MTVLVSMEVVKTGPSTQGRLTRSAEEGGFNWPVATGPPTYQNAVPTGPFAPSNFQQNVIIVYSVHNPTRVYSVYERIPPTPQDGRMPCSLYICNTSREKMINSNVVDAYQLAPRLFARDEILRSDIPRGQCQEQCC